VTRLILVAMMEEKKAGSTEVEVSYFYEVVDDQGRSV
jgi:hypothetical protein